MLVSLDIKNIGLISACQIDLAGGYTVITGETGAGKSMLMDALSLALGARSDLSLIRHGASSAQVEATFDLPQNPKILNLLNDMEIDVEEGEMVFRRVISSDKSRGFINGVRVTQTQMRELGESLVDIHGQYDHQLILRPAKHGEMLDRFGHLDQARENVQKSYRAWKKSYDALQEARMRARSAQDEEYLLRGYLKELEDLSPQTGEEVELTKERKQLMSGEKLVLGLSQALQVLNESGSVSQRFSSAESALAGMEEASEDVAGLVGRLTNLSIEVSDFANDLERMGNSFEPDPERLAQVDERLFALKDCARKHHVSVEELPLKVEELSQKLESLDNLQADMESLETKEIEDREVFEASCKALTSERAQASKDLARAIESALVHLEMPNTSFNAHMEPLEKESWSAEGAEKVEFQVATNKGAPLQALVKVASGGEVSRLMLALKKVFYHSMPPTSLVFDEVDTGVGGSVAESMGQAMKELSKNHQVFSITHLPQVAALGDTHIKIQKQDDEETTHTRLSVLKDDEREQEIARMLAGKEITAEATAAAKRLLAS